MCENRVGIISVSDLPDLGSEALIGLFSCLTFISPHRCPYFTITHLKNVRNEGQQATEFMRFKDQARMPLCHIGWAFNVALNQYLYMDILWCVQQTLCWPESSRWKCNHMVCWKVITAGSHWITACNWRSVQIGVIIAVQIRHRPDSCCSTLFWKFKLQSRLAHELVSSVD